MFINFIADSISEYKVTKNVDTNVELAPRLIKSLLRYITLSYNKITATICLHEKSRRAEEFAEKHCGK